MDYTILYRSDLIRSRNKKRRERELRRHLMTGITVIFVTVCLAVLCVFLFIYNGSKETASVYKYYTSIEVQSGETLWSIAGEKMDTAYYEDLHDYVREVSQINHVSEDQIIAGQHLIIPYYSEEYMQ